MLDLRQLSAVAEFFVICTAGSGRQSDAVREHIESTLAQQGAAIGHVEGTGDAAGPWLDGPRWVLVDCGDGVIHIFDARSREFYGLERLWADAPRVGVPVPR